MINKIAILGAGTMGSRLALLFARHKFSTILYDPDKKVLEGLKIKYSEQTLRDNNHEKYVVYTMDLQKAISKADLIIESAPEDLEIKRKLYSEISPFLKKEAIVASNTSTYSLSELSYQQSFSKRLIITHFFNPPDLIPLVEIVQLPETESGLAKEMVLFLSNCGKMPVVLKKDINGFIANRLQAAILREACYLLEQEVADAEQIDTVMKESIGLRWAISGPFEIADFGGLDIWAKVLKHLLPDLNNKEEVPESLIKKVKEKKLGIKSGKGFFIYDSYDPQKMSDERNLQFQKLLRITSVHLK